METIEEAISNALERAEALGECQLARSYRQLAEWLTELRDIKTGKTPLADRLTEEEKKKLKKLYQLREDTAELYLNASCINAQESSAIDFCKGYAWALREVFGNDMFEEEGGEK